MNWTNWKFVKWGLFGNYWIWFHMAGGNFGARIGIEFFSNIQVALGILAITLLWEIGEVVKDGGIKNTAKKYKVNGKPSVERWFYDSLGDVVGAMCMALTVIY